ncbi:MAG: DNA alkylation repair protein [Crocinitomicaceae bacterium]
MALLREKGTEQTRKTWRNHGCQAEMFGVKVGDLKEILKKTKKDHSLALDLFLTNNADAQYLAGLMADPKQFSKGELQTWAETGTWYMVSEYAVAWNVAESQFCVDLCEKWINGTDAKLQTVGWSSLCSYLLYEKRDEIDPWLIEGWLLKVEQNIAIAENRVRYAMNGFLIALGSLSLNYCLQCQEMAQRIGKVEVNLGNTSCKVPNAVDYLEKIKTMNQLGKRKKTVKC